MGYDVYLRWEGQTEAEKEAQYTGFSTVHGHVGYLREAYHGDIYATQVLAPEAFDAEDAVHIPAATLRERLPAVLNAAKRRSIEIYGHEAPDVALKSFEDFVALAERLEAEGRNPQVWVS